MQAIFELWFLLLYFALKMEKKDVDRQDDEAKAADYFAGQPVLKKVVVSARF